MSFHFQVVRGSLNIFLLLIFTSIFLWSENMFCMISALLNLSVFMTPDGLFGGNFMYT